MKIIDALQTSRCMNFCNLTSAMVVRRNSDVCQYGKQSLSNVILEKSVTKYALVAKKFWPNAKFAPPAKVKQDTPHTIWVYND